uniref:Secreted protein n=1 Tax=Ditylenchus dipsaci TaxID=166011 RepID=A0A915ENQ4_9BILA
MMIALIFLSGFPSAAADNPKELRIPVDTICNVFWLILKPGQTIKSQTTNTDADQPKKPTKKTANGWPRNVHRIPVRPAWAHEELPLRRFGQPNYPIWPPPGEDFGLPRNRFTRLERRMDDTFSNRQTRIVIHHQAMSGSGHINQKCLRLQIQQPGFHRQIRCRSFDFKPRKYQSRRTCSNQNPSQKQLIKLG